MRRPRSRALRWGWLLLLALQNLGASADPARAGAADAPALAAIAALDTSHAAAGGAWVVVMRAGEAGWRHRGDASWQSLQAGQVVPAPSEIETGPDGALELVVGGDRLVLGSNSRLVLPAREPAQDQRPQHVHGRLRVDVEQRAARSFEVRTPLLSLGIKGTSFELAVDHRQNSVLVLAGTVAVTLPGGRAAIDLGAREGLRQPVEPGAAPDRFEVADLPAVVDRAAPVRWHLPDGEMPGSSAADWSMRPVGTAQAQSPEGAREGAEPGERPGDPARHHTGWFGIWLDHYTSLVTIVLIAGGGLVILIVPAVMLGQNLRAQWRNRPVGKGRRRRSLTQG